MPRISVKDQQVHEKHQKDKAGNPVIRRFQRAALQLGGGYELPFPIALGSGPCYPLGDEYEISGESFRLGKYGDLELNPFEMKLVREAAPKKGA